MKPDPHEPTWTTKEGDKLKLSEMDRGHLENTLNYLTGKMEMENTLGISDTYRAHRATRRVMDSIEDELKRRDELTREELEEAMVMLDQQLENLDGGPDHEPRSNDAMSAKITRTLLEDRNRKTRMRVRLKVRQGELMRQHYDLMQRLVAAPKK